MQFGLAKLTDSVSFANLFSLKPSLWRYRIAVLILSPKRSYTKAATRRPVHLPFLNPTSLGDFLTALRNCSSSSSDRIVPGFPFQFGSIPSKPWALNLCTQASIVPRLLPNFLATLIAGSPRAIKASARYRSRSRLWGLLSPV